MFLATGSISSSTHVTRYGKRSGQCITDSQTFGISIPQGTEAGYQEFGLWVLTLFEPEDTSVAFKFSYIDKKLF